MKNNGNAIIVVGLAGVFWYLYTSSKGLTLTGAPAYPPGYVLPPVAGLTTVQQNGSTSTAATNLFASALSSISASVGKLLHNAPGNGPAVLAPPAYGAPTASGPVAQYAPIPLSAIPSVDPFAWLDPWLNFDQPSAAAGVPALAWTLTPDLSTIPPPPGSE